MLDFIRIACVSPGTVLGAPARNAETVCREAAAAAVHPAGPPPRIIKSYIKSLHSAFYLFTLTALRNNQKAPLFKIPQKPYMNPPCKRLIICSMISSYCRQCISALQKLYFARSRLKFARFLQSSFRNFAAGAPSSARWSNVSESPIA